MLPVETDTLSVLLRIQFLTTLTGNLTSKKLFWVICTCILPVVTDTLSVFQSYQFWAILTGNLMCKKIFLVIFVNVFYLLWRIHFQFEKVFSFWTILTETSWVTGKAFLSYLCMLPVVLDTILVWWSFQFFNELTCILCFRFSLVSCAVSTYQWAPSRSTIPAETTAMTPPLLPTGLLLCWWVSLYMWPAVQLTVGEGMHFLFSNSHYRILIAEINTCNNTILTQVRSCELSLCSWQISLDKTSVKYRVTFVCDSPVGCYLRC